MLIALKFRLNHDQDYRQRHSALEHLLFSVSKEPSWFEDTSGAEITTDIPLNQLADCISEVIDMRHDFVRIEERGAPRGYFIGRDDPLDAPLFELLPFLTRYHGHTRNRQQVVNVLALATQHPPFGSQQNALTKLAFPNSALAPTPFRTSRRTKVA